MLRKILFAPLILLAPIITLAQGHSAGAPMRMAAPMRAVSPGPAIASHAGAVGAARSAAVPTRTVGHPVAPTSTLRSASPRSTHPVGAPRAPVRTHRTQPGPAFADDFAEDDGFGVPGLGFDYPHFAATHPNANREHRNGRGFLFPGGVLLGSGPLYLEEPVTAAPPAENAQEEASAQDSQVTEPVERTAPVRSRRSPDVYTPPAQVDEYVFVRRDGTVFFAVAYSWLNSDLQYITKDGLRRTVPRSALDLDATQQFNDQRGVAFHSPA